MLSAHKKLIAEKLAEEEAERKVKGEAKKEKQLVSQYQNQLLGYKHVFFLSVVSTYLISLVAYEFLNVNIVGRKGTCETCELFGFE